MGNTDIVNLTKELFNKFDLTGFYNPTENDIYEEPNIKQNITNFKEATINLILDNFKNKNYYVILENAFKNYYVKVADAVLIYFEESLTSFNKHFNFYPDDIKRGRYAISPYMPKYSIDCDKYIMKGQTYFKSYVDFTDKHSYINNDKSLMEVLLNSTFEYLTRCCIYDIYIDASNVENETHMIICMAEKSIKNAESAVEAMEIEAKARGWMNDNPLVTIPQLEDVLYKKDGMVDEFINFLLYKANVNKLPDTMMFIYKYMLYKTVESVILYGLSDCKDIILNYNIINFDKENYNDLPDKIHVYIKKAVGIGVVLSQTNISYFHYKKARGKLNIGEELIDCIKYIPRFAINYALINNLHKLTL